ncbi:MAG: FG-GAP repeat protein, partial [Spirochaetes bacterium]|nr:FG-GAP repeat protein [Spirochaetota bacterium]
MVIWSYWLEQAILKTEKEQSIFSSGITVNKAIYANARLIGDVNSGFGHKIATADVNGDGDADLISSD